MKVITSLVLIAVTTTATVLWDGRFSNYTTATEFDAWSWNNQVGEYQTYIYGNLHASRRRHEKLLNSFPDPLPFDYHQGETASSWLTLGSQYRNPATITEAQGVKVKLTADSIWNGGPMLRTELLPQTTNSLTGNLYFHVSLQIPTVNTPDPTYENQIVFWEEHYADIKYGQITGQNGAPDTLQVTSGGQSIWSVTPVKGTWYNSILETGSPGGLWVSTGSSPLTKVFTGSLGGNGGTDWHIGALRLPLNGVTQAITEVDFYYSGIYVEDSGPTVQP